MKLNQGSGSSSKGMATAKDGVTTFRELYITDSPIVPNHAVNKAYVDSQVLDATTITGDIKFTTSSETPVGYLRCNGALVSKATYADLYNSIGDRFYQTTYLGKGKPWISQYGFNTLMPQELGAWVQAANMPASTAYSQAVLTKNRVYIFSRYNGTNYTTNVYTASVSGSGVIGTWSAGTAIPTAVAYSNIIAINSYLYLIGGYNNTGYKSTIWRCPINTDGTIGTWSVYGSLPFTVGNSAVIATRTKLYVIGGYMAGTRSNAVYYATIDSNGDLGSWIASVSLPIAVTDHGVIFSKTRICVLGGTTNTGDTAEVYCAEVDSSDNITAWIRSSNLPETCSQSVFINGTNRVHMLGGILTGATSNRIYTAIINPDGTFGTWDLTSSLPTTTHGHCVIITGSYVYILGGYRTGAISTRVDYVYALGGLNSYETYYSTIPPAPDPTKFTLPDYSAMERFQIYAYIRY